MRKIRLRKNNGITLIALVITIIVLLILAGVAISMLSGENGILNKAKEAKEKTEEGQKQEEEALSTMELETYFLTNNSKYKCRYGMITGIELGVTTAKDLQDSLPSEEYKIYSKDEQNELNGPDKISTGVAIKKDGKIIARVVVFGDVNGDGIIDSSDASCVRQLIQSVSNYEDYEIMAMDVNHDNEIREDVNEDISDYHLILSAYENNNINQDKYVTNLDRIAILGIKLLQEEYINGLDKKALEKAGLKFELNTSTNKYKLKGVTTNTLVETVTNILPNSSIYKGSTLIEAGNKISKKTTLKVTIEEKYGFSEISFSIDVTD